MSHTAPCPRLVGLARGFVLVPGSGSPMLVTRLLLRPWVLRRFIVARCLGPASPLVTVIAATSSGSPRGHSTLPVRAHRTGSCCHGVEELLTALKGRSS